MTFAVNFPYTSILAACSHAIRAAAAARSAALLIDGVGPLEGDDDVEPLGLVPIKLSRLLLR